MLNVPNFVTSSHGWLIFFTGAFKGKVIDLETKQPIEGAVVVAKYHKYECGPLPFFIVGCSSDTFDAKETLTNKNGEFYLWPQISFGLWPMAVGANTTFIIFKPGYKYMGGYLNETRVEELTKLKTKEEIRKEGLPAVAPAGKLKLLEKAEKERNKMLGYED